MSTSNIIANSNIQNMSSSTEVTEEYVVKEVKSFDEINLNENLLRGIYSMGYTTPSQIQRKAILPMIQHHDLIAQAQSGTGKTATFLIGSLQQVDVTLNRPQVLVICPNHELAQQIYYNYSCLSQYMKLKSSLLIGGTSIDENIKSLDKGAQFIVGTPGRIQDMIKRYVLKMTQLKCVVIDEADEMLSKGFKEQLQEIFKFIPKQSQVCVFSATMPDSTLEIMNSIMNSNVVRILVNPEEVTLDGIDQYYLGVDDESWKVDTLVELYERLRINQTIIFINGRRKAESLKEQLEQQMFTVALIHGEMKHVEREQVMRSFRTGESRILLATDVIARGIDIQQVSVVINYDMPRQCETYIHRIGRTGRYGRKGIAINFVTQSEVGIIDRLQKWYKTTINPFPDNLNDLF
jgi:superfamily II DNA/RNA helicase